jgi:hypothetical protein
VDRTSSIHRHIFCSARHSDNRICDSSFFHMPSVCLYVPFPEKTGFHLRLPGLPTFSLSALPTCRCSATLALLFGDKQCLSECIQFPTVDNKDRKNFKQGRLFIWTFQNTDEKRLGPDRVLSQPTNVTSISGEIRESSTGKSANLLLYICVHHFG